MCFHRSTGLNFRTPNSHWNIPNIQDLINPRRLWHRYAHSFMCSLAVFQSIQDGLAVFPLTKIHFEKRSHIATTIVVFRKKKVVPSSQCEVCWVLSYLQNPSCQVHQWLWPHRSLPHRKRGCMEPWDVGRGKVYHKNATSHGWCFSEDFGNEIQWNLSPA